jgi:hypothetical protein
MDCQVEWACHSTCSWLASWRFRETSDLLVLTVFPLSKLAHGIYALISLENRAFGATLIGLSVTGMSRHVCFL